MLRYAAYLLNVRMSVSEAELFVGEKVVVCGSKTGVEPELIQLIVLIFIKK